MAHHAMAYLREFIRVSYAGFRLFMIESRLWFEAVDGIRNTATKKYALTYARAARRMTAKQRAEKKITARGFWVLIKAKEQMELKPGDGIDPPRAGEAAAATVESDGWSTTDDEAEAAAAKARKQKKSKKNKSGNKGKGPKPGKKGKAAAADGNDRETRTCHHCKKVGHLERNCWTKYPEQRPGSGSGAAVTGTAPEKATAPPPARAFLDSAAFFDGY